MFNAYMTKFSITKENSPEEIGYVLNNLDDFFHVFEILNSALFYEYKKGYEKLQKTKIKGYNKNLPFSYYLEEAQLSYTLADIKRSHDELTPLVFLDLIQGKKIFVQQHFSHHFIIDDTFQINSLN